MGFEPRAGEIYRLIVAYDRRLLAADDQRLLVADERRYARFEDAQAEVAKVVCRYGHLGPVRAVALQRGRPSRSSKPNGANGGSEHGRNGGNRKVNGNGSQNAMGATPLLSLKGVDFLWTIEKSWGRDVVARILTQNGISAPGCAAALTERQFPPRGNGRWRGHSRRSSPARSQRNIAHKNTRWPVLSTTIVILLSIVVLFLFQSGGHPLHLLGGLLRPQPMTKEELPFDARTSFTPKASISSTQQASHPTDF